EKTVREALGAEKGDRFLALVRREVGGQDPNALANAQPNSVPSDTRIVVNAPAYRMDVFENGQLKKSFKVGIGYPEFPLPTGLRRANELLFNPTWTPPDEPWVKGNVQPGKTVEAGSKLNPLGIVKIPIGLPSLIHAGKSADRLGTFASHGCVGLTNDQAREFSLLLASLGGADLTEEDIAGFRKNSSKTEAIKLERDIPVELRYETIVVQDGTLRIMRDVYERGTNTEENLRRVLLAFGVSLDNLQPDMRERILDGLEQMAVDASGKPVEPGSANTNANANSNSNSSRVTRNIKGAKEVTFEVAELRGKGYPAPVDAKF
nr:L,D-transpeptidase [Blastocatellia bacterium]